MLRLLGGFSRKLALTGRTGNRRWLSAERAMGRLEGKVAVITGGASGLGKATAQEFIGEGATVILADVNSDLGLQTAQDLGPQAHFIRCDVAVEEDIAAAVDTAVARHGRLDVMFNNAGIVGPLAAMEIASLDLAHFDQVMGVNVRGTVAGIKHAARVMGPVGSGSILCTASISGLLGGLGTYPYSVSKCAIAGVVRAAAGELARQGVRINCISPFAVPTPMLLEQLSQVYRGADEANLGSIIAGFGEFRGATCEAADVARAAVFLASDEAKYVSGHNLVMDGGFTTYKHFNMPQPSSMQ